MQVHMMASCQHIAGCFMMPINPTVACSLAQYQHDRRSQRFRQIALRVTEEAWVCLLKKQACVGPLCCCADRVLLSPAVLAPCGAKLLYGWRLLGLCVYICDVYVSILGGHAGLVLC